MISIPTEIAPDAQILIKTHVIPTWFMNYNFPVGGTYTNKTELFQSRH